MPCPRIRPRGQSSQVRRRRDAADVRVDRRAGELGCLSHVPSALDRDVAGHSAGGRGAYDVLLPLLRARTARKFAVFSTTAWWPSSAARGSGGGVRGAAGCKFRRGLGCRVVGCFHHGVTGRATRSRRRWSTARVSKLTPEKARELVRAMRCREDCRGSQGHGKATGQNSHPEIRRWCTTTSGRGRSYVFDTTGPAMRWRRW
jgi:hypothetical protein